MITKTEMTNSPLDPGLIVGWESPWRWSVPLVAGFALVLLLILGKNVELFYFMNRVLSNAPDGLWTHFSLLADGKFIILFVLPFLGRRPDIVWQYILATLIGGLYIQGLKEGFSALRPPASLLEGSFHLIGPALQNNSFPSGHTAAAFILAGIFCLQRVNVSIKFAVLLLAIFVGLSRIANGVHWPLDVLAGAGGGWLVAIVAVWLSRRWRGGMNKRFQQIFALIVTPLSIWAVWSIWQHLDDVYPGTGMMKIVFLATCLGLSLPGQLRLFNLRK